MYLNGPIFSHKPSKIELMEQACEAASSTVKHKFKEEYTLRDKYFKYVESFLPHSEKILFRYIAKYEDKNSTLLNSPYLLKIIPFSERGDDTNIVFKCTNIDQEELAADMKKVPLPGNLTEKAAFMPLQVVLFLIIRYYMITNQPEKMKKICYYYGYSLYWKRYSKQFKIGVDEKVMIYTINDLSYRSLIKKLGSVREMLGYIIMGRYQNPNYREMIVDACDEDIRYLLDQCQSDLGSKMVDIANKYYDNYENKRMIYQGKTLVNDEGEQRNDTSVTATAETLAQKYTNDFFMSDLNMNRIKSAAALAKEVSVKELKNTIDYILNNANPADIHTFYSAVFYIYLTMDDPRANEESVKSLKFLALMRDIIKKGNSNDVNIVKIIKLMDQWLMQGSNTFRVTKREGTQTSYRKAVYYYFILSVTNNR